MSESIEKLRPDRDLQCFFFRPSAIAAMSNATPGGYTVSGTWRQQFDWTVVEWNRNNVYEHPNLRSLPDGDLSGLTLTYNELRTNCIAVDSDLFPTVDWPYLRIWADDVGGVEQIYRVPLIDHATPVTGSFVAAQASFTLSGALTAGDVVELAWQGENYFHTILATDTIASVLAALDSDINVLSSTVSATHDAGAGTITLTNLDAGADGNRLGIVATVSGAQTEIWSPPSQQMSGGGSPSEWQISLDFSTLLDTSLNPVPTSDVRKMRWTYAADLQPVEFARSEFSVVHSSWSVTGTNRVYSVAGNQGHRVEDDGNVTYTGTWSVSDGNFSGSTIRHTTTVGSKATVSYSSSYSHELFLGTRFTASAGKIDVSVDAAAALSFDLFVPDEDYLARVSLGAFPAGTHTVEARLTGANVASTDSFLNFDFVEAAIAVPTVDAVPPRGNETAATDWDTDHSLALAPERVAWNLDMLGFKGRANHYAGAILFYELHNPANQFASNTVTFQGTPVFSQNVQVVIGGTVFSRLTLSTDTNESIAKHFEFLINGSTGVWAAVVGNVLTITARLLGIAGNALTVSASPATGTFQAVAAGTNLAGGVDGLWFTDTGALPRINRAARDWHQAYFTALDSLGIEVTAGFSTELSHGDPSAAAGIAQRYPDGSPVVLNTPAVQTNFSPTSIAYWQQVYLEMADLQVAAGLTPYLQFGEVQWWYFPEPPGMTFYDDYTTSEFQSQHGRAMNVFLSNDDGLAGFPEEAAFLPGLIGTYTQTIRDFVRAIHPITKFEVLYPHDVNDHALTRVVNYPDTDWTPANLEVLKTENFTYTGDFNLDKSVESIRFPFTKGFARNRSAHLIGVFRTAEPWNWERRLTHAEGHESVVLWAFDQFSMIGYRLPLSDGVRRSRLIR